MTHYFKAVRPDGFDFHSGTVDYGSALGTDRVVVHPHPGVRIRPHTPHTYLSVSTDPAWTLVVSNDHTAYWPARLLRVEPVDEPVDVRTGTFPCKWAVRALRAVQELPAHQALGPMGEAAVRPLERLRRLTAEESALMTRPSLDQDIARGHARELARDSGRVLPFRTLSTAVGRTFHELCADDVVTLSAANQASLAVMAELVGDLLPYRYYELMTYVWRFLPDHGLSK